MIMFLSKYCIHLTNSTEYSLMPKKFVYGTVLPHTLKL